MPEIESEGGYFRSPENEWPVIDLTIDEHVYPLRWDNTEIRKFLIGNGEFDHILHEASKEQFVFIFIHQLKDPTIIDALEINNFPYTLSPILDNMTINLYARSHNGAIEELMPNDQVIQDD